jgi:hypothetical protein
MQSLTHVLSSAGIPRTWIMPAWKAANVGF